MLEAMRIDGNAGGAVTANVNMRAPIYYDSANTAYYLDPASTGTSLITAGGVYAAGQVRAAGWWGDASPSATGLAVPGAVDETLVGTDESSPSPPQAAAASTKVATRTAREYLSRFRAIPKCYEGGRLFVGALPSGAHRGTVNRWRG